MKRFFRKKGSLFLCLCLLILPFGIPGVSAASPPENAGTAVCVRLDGAEILPGECRLIDGVTYVPLRRFCGLFGVSDLSWNGKTGTASVRSEFLSMTVPVGERYIQANGHFFYTVGTVRNLSGSIYVPVRPMARAFALSLNWDAGTSSVSLSRTVQKAVVRASYDPDTVYWLSRIISSEARGECLEGQIAVGNVVYNRVASDQYPNTVWGVIFDRKYGTQFSPVSFGTIYNAPSERSIIAAKICMEGYSLTDRALFFVNPSLATSNWIQRNRSYLFTIGCHEFYA